MLFGRDAERARLDALLADARAKRSGTLALRGEPGIGKSALLDHAVAAADGFTVIGTAGVEFEAEIPFAGLHMLLRPLLHHLRGLPGQLADALGAAFGLTPTGGGDRFLVGMAVLTLLSEAAETQPLLAVVDDVQWLDHASIEAILFAARRLEREGVVLLFALRDDSGSQPLAHGLAAVPELPIGGLDQQSSNMLLAHRHPDLVVAVRDRMITESDGNPLALIELPTALTSGQRAGVGILPAPHVEPLPLTTRLHTAFGAQANRLGPDAATLLLVAATEETGDIDVVLRAAAKLGAGADALDEVERSGILRVAATTLTFKHPLARSAVRHRATLRRRLAVHEALAAALTDPAASDRRAWHLAAASTGPDEFVAAALEAAADLAARRSGFAAQSAALERAAALSPDPGRRVQRMIAAAEAAASAGDFRHALDIARRTHCDAADTLSVARLSSVTAGAESAMGRPLIAARTLSAAAESIMVDHPDRAARMLVDAVSNSYLVGETEIAAKAAATLEAIASDKPVAVSIGGLARLMTDDLENAMPRMRRLPEATRHQTGVAPGCRLMAGMLASRSGCDELAVELLTALVDDARDSGQIGILPGALCQLAMAEVHVGHLREALVHADEGLRLGQSTGQWRRLDDIHCVLAIIAAIQGDDERCRALAEPALDHAVQHGLTYTAAGGMYALELADLIQGRYDAVLDRLDPITTGMLRTQSVLCIFAADRVEAAARARQPARAVESARRMQRWAAANGQPWTAAMALRCQGLLATGDDEAEDYFGRAVELHSHGGRPFERARTHLVYGEMLRRANRKIDARTHLRSALDTFQRLGARPWADRALAEIRATGEAGVQSPGRSAYDTLTPKELQVVRLAATGLSNRDIAARLFLSHRTVGYHLYNAFPKLGIANRAELGRLSLD
ncbi:AAA family ATPase [Nocardia sp. NPDC101769]|uniref:AAA family ATPase n=1 Tax=Nocardia sp. NPDC101769 TaxID=3364333 RepID=UPI0038160286